MSIERSPRLVAVRNANYDSAKQELVIAMLDENDFRHELRLTRDTADQIATRVRKLTRGGSAA